MQQLATTEWKPISYCRLTNYQSLTAQCTDLTSRNKKWQYVSDAPIQSLHRGTSPAGSFKDQAASVDDCRSVLLCELGLRVIPEQSFKLPKDSESLRVSCSLGRIVHMPA